MNMTATETTPSRLHMLGGHAFRLADRVLPRGRTLDRAILQMRYWRAHGRLPRKVSDPQATFNDLIFARMAEDSWTVLERACIDKEYAKLLAKALCPQVKICETTAVIPLAQGHDVDWLAARLAARRGRREIAKPTHGSGTVLFLAPSPSEEAIRQFCARAMQSYYATSRESEYKDQERKIILEQDLSLNGVPPTDYKFFCARGDVLFCQIDVGRFRDHRRMLVTPGFETIPVRYAHDLPEKPPQRPENFTAMLEIAAALSRRFAFVRIDLYSAPDGVYFGEFTFAPEGGAGSLSNEAFGSQVLRQVTARTALREEALLS